MTGYGYEDYIDLTPEQILQKVSQEQIFEFLLNDTFAYPPKYYKAPYREDKHAGCFFGVKSTPEGDIIFFQDFAQPKGYQHKNCFKLAIDVFTTDLSGAIRRIIEHFGISKDSKDYAPTKKIHTTSIEKETKQSDIIIEYEKRPIEKKDIRFFNQFIITPDNLEEDNVYPAIKAKIISPRKIKAFNIYNLCYAIDFIDAVKLYQPYSSTHKFITNCNENHIGNFDNLPNTGRKLIIAKGYKDHRVFRNLDLGLDVIWNMNEGAIPSLEIIRSFIFRFEEIIIFYDNDTTGIRAAKIYMELLNSIRPNIAKMKYIPINSKNIKDIAEYISIEGRKDTIKLLEKLNIV